MSRLLGKFDAADGCRERIFRPLAFGGRPFGVASCFLDALLACVNFCWASSAACFVSAAALARSLFFESLSAAVFAAAAFSAACLAASVAVARFFSAVALASSGCLAAAVFSISSFSAAVLRSFAF